MQRSAPFLGNVHLALWNCGKLPAVHPSDFIFADQADLINELAPWANGAVTTVYPPREIASTPDDRSSRVPSHLKIFHRLLGVGSMRVTVNVSA
jgi:hypothetical protein